MQTWANQGAQNGKQGEMKDLTAAALQAQADAAKAA